MNPRTIVTVGGVGGIVSPGPMTPQTPEQRVISAGGEIETESGSRQTLLLENRQPALFTIVPSRRIR